MKLKYGFYYNVYINSKIKNYKKNTIIIGFPNPIQIKFILLAKIIGVIYKLLL